MKIKALLIGLLLTSGITFGQDPANQNTPDATNETSAEGSLKPEEGAFTFEVNFTPFDDTPIGLNYLRGRLFLQEDLAARIGISIAYQGQNDANIFSWTLAPGIEKHFGGTKRISPYVGAEMVLANRISSFNPDERDFKVSGATSETGENRGFFSFGLNGLVGVDFYVVKHLYLGFEAGYGFSVISNSNIEITSGGITSEVQERSTAFQIGPNVNAAIRLGFVLK